MRTLIEAEVGRTGTIRRVYDIRTMHMGPNDVLATVRLDFDDAVAAASVEHIVAELEHAIRQRDPDIRQLFRAHAGRIQLTLDHLGEALADVDEAAVHIGIAHHGNAQHPRRFFDLVVRPGRVPALGIDGCQRLRPVRMVECGVPVRHVAHHVVDRHVRQDVVGLQHEPEHHKFHEGETGEHNSASAGRRRSRRCSGAALALLAPAAERGR